MSSMLRVRAFPGNVTVAFRYDGRQRDGLDPLGSQYPYDVGKRIGVGVGAAVQDGDAARVCPLLHVGCHVLGARAWLPSPRIEVPEDRLVTPGGEMCARGEAASAVREAEETHRLGAAKGARDGSLGVGDFERGRDRGDLGKQGVEKAVAAELVPTCYDLADDLGIVVRIAPEHKECGAHILASQGVQYLPRCTHAGLTVKGQCQVWRVRGTVTDLVLGQVLRAFRVDHARGQARVRELTGRVVRECGTGCGVA